MNINTASERMFNIPFLKKIQEAHPHHKELRIPYIGFLPNRIRNHFIAFMGEFVGTFLFLFFAFSGTQVANAANSGADTNDGSLSQIPNASTLGYISLVFGFSLAVNAWVFFRVSGGLFNPAVTLGMGLIGAVTWTRAGLVFLAQMLGSMASAGVVSALFPGPLNVSTALGGGTTIAQGLFIEMFLTAELVFAIFMLAAEKHKGTFLAPVGIGLALFIAELSGVYFTGGSLNPARSFGPCVVLHVFPKYHWIYWLGPALGSLLAVIFYRFVKVLEYETANPGQDFNEQEAEVFQFDEDNAATAADVARPAPEDLRVLSMSSRATSHGAGEGGRTSETIESRLEHSSDGPENNMNRVSTHSGHNRVSTGEHLETSSAQMSNTHREAPSGQASNMLRSDPNAQKRELGGNYTVSGLGLPPALK